MSDQFPNAGPGNGRRKPAAFVLDEDKVRFGPDDLGRPLKGEAVILPDLTEDDLAAGASTASLPAKRKKTGFGKWLAIGLGGLVSLSVGLAVDSLIRDLFTRTDWLGWTGVALAALAVCGLLGLIASELLSLRRVAKIDHLREALSDAASRNDTKAAQKSLGELTALYSGRPETAHGRQILAGHMREVIDGRDLVILAERDLLAPLDAQARALVMSSAKHVSLVTSVSPRALVDLLAVLYVNMRTIRQLSELYGGRPGTLGFLRLARHVATHLALTGGMAAGDSLASQVLGHGLAARLSARLGEGVINGLLTARIGIAAIAVCRPAPFLAGKGPKLSDFMGELVSRAEKQDKQG
ncbi:YcjF family protein [Roseibium suaedae]|uniref:Putative membrane protein n=1 Tax=Roseibium suaedae TaxID=735517 RepID=A0A1M7GJ56_9HYPH|nr:TIGR01620 family protein [Roseibium suaedae]SHM16442.1 putative membrane protein [Roseibium suaedae]